VRTLVERVCDRLVAVTDGRLQPTELGATTRLWSLAGEESADLDSIEVLALLKSIEDEFDVALPPQLELMPTATVGDIATYLEEHGGPG
jgi:Phosphopantetheine attachment site